MSLPTRKIGNDDVTAIGFGLMGLSVPGYGPVLPDEERFEVLDAALEAGCTNWDTADIYFDSEELVGKWFKRTGKRNEIFLATKFGNTPTHPNGTPEYVKATFEQSLKRLGVDQVDLYYFHRADPTTPIEITIGAMAELVKAGKVRYLGLSEVSESTLRRAHAVHPIAALQIEYSPFFLDIENDKVGLLKACRELGIAVVAYSPLGRGMLTGTYKSYDDIPEGDWRKNVEKFGPKNFHNIVNLVDGLQALAAKKNVTSSQVTLAWLLAQGNDIIPIPGTKKIKYLKENLAALKVQLTPDEISEVRRIADIANESSVGGRYPENDMKWVLGDTPAL